MGVSNPIRRLRERRRLSQEQLARLAGTSQPTIAAYESGTKSPRLSTVERLARAVDLEAVVDFVPSLTREDRRSLALHRAVAERLEEEPASILARARRMVERMSRQHPGARPLLSRWRGILRRPVDEIVEVLLDPRPSARELRHVTPFAGVLDAAERAAIYRRFAADEAGRR
jgi:transcriptional regulator with XRE-family HTH domain